MASRKEYEMLFSLNAQLGGSYNSTFKSAQGAITSMQKEIENLSKTQSDVSAYQKQQNAVDATQKKLQLLQQQYDNIQKEISETGEFSADLQNKLLAKQQQLDRTSTSLERQTQKLGQMSAALRDAGVDTDNLSADSSKLGAQIDDLKQKQEAAASEANNFGSEAANAIGSVHQALAAAGIAVALKEIYEAFKACAEASVEFESAMTGVAKTTDFSDKELAAMSSSIKELSTDIPITTDELGQVAEVAGQLGIAKADLLDFTTTMSMLGTATTMTADDAATMLAQFANITQMDPSYYDEMASAIVDLGNTYATTEQKITEMSQGIAASASLAGMSEADMMGLSAAVSSLGIESEMGSTSVSKLISMLMTAVETGDDLDQYARVANMSAAEFTKAWGEDAAGALENFVVGLSDTERLGASAVVTLTDLGVTETRMQRTILSLSNSGDLLTRTIGTANQAWDENNALQTEAGKRYATTASQQTMAASAYNNLKIAVGDNYTPVLRKLYALENDVLKGLTEFVENNPTLIKAATAFVAVIGAVVAGLAAFAAITKIVIPLMGMLTASIPGVNIIMGVAAGVAAITAGIVALVSASNEAVPSVKELTEAASGMSETMDAAAETYDETVTSTLAAAGVADTYIGKLEDMEAAGLSTDEQHRQYHNTLALLCQVVPELADNINLETDTINGGTDALRANTEAWKKNAMQQAYQAQLTALYESYSSVLIEAEENSIGLTKAQYELDAANKKQNDSIAKMDKLWAKAAEQADAQAKEFGTMTDATYFLTQEYYDLQNSLYGVNDEIWAAEQSMKNYQKAIEEDGEATAEAEEQIALAEEAVRNLTSATEEGAESTAEAARQEQELQGSIADVTTEITTLTESYNEAYEAALGSINGQYDLWDKVATPVATAAGAINSALESQITYWQDYNANLQNLTERGAEISGLSEVISSFADGSKDSVNAIAGMANASDEDLSAMVQNWKSLQEEQKNATTSVADLKTGFTAAMDELQKELASDIESMDLGTEAAESGKATIQGFVDGAAGMIPSVQAAYGRVAQAAISAIDEKMQIHSPSRVMMEKAEMTWAGYIKQTEAMTPEVKAAMAGTAGAGTEAFSAEEAQMVTFAPQLVAYLNSMNGSAVSADAFSGTGSAASTNPATPPVSITFHIEGSASPETVDALRAYSDDFVEAVLQVIENSREDATRRAYR